MGMTCERRTSTDAISPKTIDNIVGVKLSFVRERSTEMLFVL